MPPEFDHVSEPSIKKKETYARSFGAFLIAQLLDL